MSENYTTAFDPEELIDNVTAAQAGNRDAFGKLFERYYESILALAIRRLRDTADAEELTQEVFLQAMLKIRQLRTPLCFPAWLRSIARRKVINRVVRAEPAQPVAPETLDAHVAELATPLILALKRERRDLVRDGITRLKPIDRDTLEGFYLRGQSLRDLSASMDAPVGTVKRRLHTARQRISLGLSAICAN